MIAIRGATTVLVDSKEEILTKTKNLLTSIIEKNSVDIDQIVSIIFTATKDIESVYPAVSAREIGITNASLMCFQEMHVFGSLPRCIRVSMMINENKAQKDVKHIYLEDAKLLRPDLAE